MCIGKCCNGDTEACQETMNHSVLPGPCAECAALAARDKKIAILELKNRASLVNNLCPDHRDKQAGKPCLACEIERQETEIASLKEQYPAALKYCKVHRTIGVMIGEDLPCCLIDDLKQEFDSLLGHHEAQQKDWEQCKDELDIITRMQDVSIDKFNKQLADLKQANSDLVKEIADLRLYYSCTHEKESARERLIAQLNIENDALREEITGLRAEIEQLKLFNPCGHTGFESAPCSICGYPDSRKLIADLKAEIAALYKIID